MNKINFPNQFTLRAENDDSIEWEAKFSSPILNHIISKNFIYTVVLTEPEAKSSDQCNIFCVQNSNGKIVWKKTANKTTSNDNIYTSVKFTDNDRLVVWDWDGNKEEIEIATGRIIDRNFMK